ncbi:MAG: ferric iron uptake transcriptional regulator [Gammaproteobacteria bacterium]|nr:MAG: ferric iron uptake transcriptional regulator [Gammaproteobacteria bacterium]
MEKADLKKAGLKVTLPRMKILEILQNSEKKHLSAEDIYKLLLEAGEEIGLATVYRVLTQFEAANLVTRHHFEGGQAVFELEQGEHHDHLVCIKCGKVEEFLNETIESCQQKIADNAGYRITDHALIIYGVCPDCQQAEQKGRR